jgi:lysocardiolipin and lysophospholipid acyltransferase
MNNNGDTRALNILMLHTVTQTLKLGWFLLASLTVHLLQWLNPFSATWNQWLARLFASQLFDFCPKTQIHLYDWQPLPKSCLLTANHQIYVDWLFIWFLTYISRVRIVIVLKEELKSVPIFGWGMSLMRFLFLKRKLSVDLERIENFIKKNQWDYNMLIFPEGTVLTHDTREKTLSYAHRSGLQPYAHVLLPRASGLFHICKKSNAKTLIDFTIGYHGVSKDLYAYDVYPIEKLLLHNHSPKEVHVHCHAINLSEIPGIRQDHLSEEEQFKLFSDWLMQLYRQKDEKLAYFYKHGKPS